MLAVFLDTETNGLNPHKHCLLEIAYAIIDVETGQSKCLYEAVVKQPLTKWQQGDPRSLEINGLDWETISHGKPPEEVAADTITHFAQNTVRQTEAVFICQNPSFDRAFVSQLISPELQESLAWPYHWLDLASMYWAQRVHQYPHPWQTGISKDAIAQNCQIPPEKKPHRAMQGVIHLFDCYQAVVGFPKRAKEVQLGVNG